MKRRLGARPRPWGVLTALFILACGTEQPLEAPPEPVAQRAAPLGLATESTCAVAQVAWDHDTTRPDDQKACAGPWEYQAYVRPCYAETVSSACPRIGWEQKECIYYQSCRHAAFGVERYADVVRTPTVTGWKHEGWECMPGSPCHYVVEYEYDNRYDCYSAVETVRDQEPGGWAQSVYPWVTEGPIVSQPGVSGPFTQTCTITLYDLPIYHQRAEPPCPESHRAQCDSDIPIYGACRAEAHGNAPTESECGLADGGATRLSAQGLSLSSLKGSFDPAAAVELTPSCTTCDDLPMQTATGVNLKYQCLQARVNQLQASGATVELQTAAAQLRRLIEVKGHLLPPARQVAARNFYRDPRFQSDCGNTLQLPAISAACDASIVHDRSFLQGVCHPLTLDHVDPATTRMMLGGCLEFIDTVPVDPLCGLQPYAEPYRDISLTLLKKVLSAPSGESGTERQQRLLANLEVLEQWRARALNRLYVTDDYRDVDPRFWEELSGLMGAFWKGAYDSEQQIGSTLAPEDLDDLSAAYMKVDRDVLLAAFDAQGTVDSALLLPIISDAFRGMVDRLRVASASHDLGCRYLSCAGGTLNTEVSELWKLLSRLDDKFALQAALNGATKVRSEWRTVFQRIVDQHSRLDGAASDVLIDYTPTTMAFMQTLAAEQMPQIAVSFTQLLREARIRTASYEEHGLFDSVARNVLHRGMNTSPDEQLLLDGELDRVRNQLTQDISDYTFTRESLVQDLVMELRNQQVQASGIARIVSQVERLRLLSEDLAGLRNNVEVANARQGDFMKAFDDLIATTDLNQLVQQSTVPPFAVHAGNAVFPGGKAYPGDLLSNMAVRVGSTAPWVYPVQAGDFVTLEVTGQWSPTCAMSQGTYHLPSTGGAMAPIHVTRTEQGPTGPQTVPVYTGPEGFMLDYQNSAFHAKSKQSVKENGSYKSYSSAQSICAGVSASAGTPGLLESVYGASVKVYANAETCFQWDKGTRSSDSDIDADSDGEESRSVAAFTTGLRVPNTPFPQLPAGSLLLLEVTRPTPPVQAMRLHVRNVHVLQAPYTAIAVDRDADLHLVVNDSTGCGTMPAGNLTVNVKHSRPLAASLQQVGRAMATVRAQLRAAFPDYLRQGRLLPQDLSALRNQAFAQLATECACNVNDASKIPTTFNGLFSAWIEHDLATLQRQVEIRAVTREQSLMLLELKALKDDLAMAQAEARWVRMLPLWSLRDLDGSRLDARTRTVVTTLNQYLYPIIHLRYPSVIAALANDSASRDDLLELVNMDWMAPALDRAERVLDVEADIRDKLAAARLPTNPLTPKYVALTFPRPGHLARTPYRQVSDSRAAQVWNHLLTTNIASFTVLPEDFYAATGGNALLLCQEGTPVIRAMGLFLLVNGVDGGALSGALATRPYTRMDSQLAFPTLSGLESYRQLNEEWLSGGIPVTYGGPLDALGHFNQYALPHRAGNGLSPFTRFDINGTVLMQPIVPGESPIIDVATEFVLVFQVEPRQLTSPMTWIRTCRTSAGLTAEAEPPVELSIH
ncbi:seawater-induced protein 61-2 [Myxococcus sp. 1LA]